MQTLNDYLCLSIRVSCLGLLASVYNGKRETGN
jgi:hypothetical protein